MLLKEQTSTHLADLFSALSDPTRLRIISVLLDGEMNVGDIAAQLEMTEFGGVAPTARTASNAAGPQSQKWAAGLITRSTMTHVAKLYRLGLDHVEHG